MLKKIEPAFANGLLGFITLGIYTQPARVLFHMIKELPIDMGNSICTAH